MRSLTRKLEEGGAVVGGVLSGTSGDGIDVALCRFATRRGASGYRLWSVECSAFRTSPFPRGLDRRVRAALDGDPLGARELALLSRDLGRAFGAAARALALEAGLELDLVGSHGLTVWHHDGRESEGRASLQLGEGDHVAEEAGCAVVSDFRQRDLAAGGEGAPISALADDLLFAREPRPLAVLNLGGMSNLSWLGRAADDLLSFDCGPAGSLLDGLARRLLDRPYDAGGERACAGRADERLVQELLEHPFFRTPIPRSTGRDTFGEAWVDEVVERAQNSGTLRAGGDPADLFASAAAFVAEAVARSLRDGGVELPGRLLVAGGGVHHRRLQEELGARLGVEVFPTSVAGIDPDAREALVFATLAARCVLGEAVTRSSATGASPGRVLGKISPPAR